MNTNFENFLQETTLFKARSTTLVKKLPVQIEIVLSNHHSQHLSQDKNFYNCYHCDHYNFIYTPM